MSRHSSGRTDTSRSKALGGLRGHLKDPSPINDEPATVDESGSISARGIPASPGSSLHGATRKPNLAAPTRSRTRVDDVRGCDEPLLHALSSTLSWAVQSSGWSTRTTGILAGAHPASGGRGTGQELVHEVRFCKDRVARSPIRASSSKILSYVASHWSLVSPPRLPSLPDAVRNQK